MDKIVQRKNENRKDYLLRVALSFIDEEQTARYDGAICDGACLKEDIENVLTYGV